jgi:Domain of unknown function (DUF4386)
MIPVYLIVTLLLYDLLKPVNASLALLAVFCSLMGGAVGAINSVLHFAPLVLLRDASVGVLNAEQLQALTLVCLKLLDQGFTISLVFYGSYCFLIGCLIVGSTFIPRSLGALMAAAGLAYMTYSFADFVSPSLAANLRLFVVIPGFIGETSLTGWLLVVGVSASRWRNHASEARGCASAD